MGVGFRGGGGLLAGGGGGRVYSGRQECLPHRITANGRSRCGTRRPSPHPSPPSASSGEAGVPGEGEGPSGGALGVAGVVAAGADDAVGVEGVLDLGGDVPERVGAVVELRHALGAGAVGDVALAGEGGGELVVAGLGPGG